LMSTGWTTPADYAERLDWFATNVMPALAG
jgi:hypothetical protein